MFTPYRKKTASKARASSNKRAIYTDTGAQQSDFPRPRPADHAENFAAEDVEIETVMYRLGPKPVDKAAYADDRFARLTRHAQICNAEKKIEKPASVTITRNIASTTESVVRRPTLSALRATWNPS